MGIGFKKFIYISSSCFLAGLTLGVLSFAQETRVMSVNRVIVVDSKGKTLGEAIGGLGLITTSGGARGSRLQPTILLRVGQHLAAVNVDRDRFFGGALWFELENCGGTAWFAITPANQPPGLLPAAAVGPPPGQTLYVQPPGAAPQSVTTNSFTLDGLNCFNSVISQSALPAQPLVNLLTVFTPPFSLRAAP